MTRRRLTSALLLGVPVALLAEEGTKSVRGALTQRLGQKPALTLSDGRVITPTGDGPTLAVLNDKRLAGADLEVIGHYTGANEFAIEPIHKRALFVYKDGKRLMVTYWCDICAIRTYSPGKCWCCQEETALDLREPE